MARIWQDRHNLPDTQGAERIQMKMCNYQNYVDINILSTKYKTK